MGRVGNDTGRGRGSYSNSDGQLCDVSVTCIEEHICYSYRVVLWCLGKIVIK